jgi:UDP-glucose 4-epimerase
MKGNPSDSFNLGTGVGISVREMITAIERLYDVKLKVINAEPRAGDPPALVAQAARAQDILQWDPRNSTLDLMIKSAYASLLKHVK